jgi:hypothetical protein
VVEISSIKVKPGKFNEYMAYLAGLTASSWK